MAIEPDHEAGSALGRAGEALKGTLLQAAVQLREATPRARAALAAGGVTMLLTMTVVARWANFDPCPADVPCVSVEALLDGAPLPEAIHLYDRYDAPLADVAGPRRTSGAGEVHQRLERAFVAVEDRRFWRHGGVDARGIVRAALRNLRSSGLEEGASTIPMQLARSVWAESLGGIGPWRRKLFEARTARRLVHALGHERVLELYLDAIYLGDGVYGVVEASRHYFGVPPRDLALPEIALLVGMTSSPERFDPRDHPEAARARRAVVIDLLVEAGLASPAEAAVAKAAPLPEPVADRKLGRGYASAAVTRELRRVAPELAGIPGLRVYTTLDTLVQRAGERSLDRHLDRIEPDPGAEPLQGAVVALDVHTGAVRGWVGGRSFSASEFDRVEQAHRQVGSLVKPFVVATALEGGRGILDLVSADTFSLSVSDGTWSPADHVGQVILPVREALVRSSNRAAVRLGREVGVASVRRVVRRAGIASEMADVPSTLIGSFESTLLEMTAAYAVFGNGGFRVTPYLIRRIEDRDGAILWSAEAPDPGRALDSLTAFTVLDALRDVVNRGTGWPVRQSGYHGPAAGKTGTTDEGRDAWFIGLVPGLVAGVWIGYDRPRPISADASGGGLAAPVWSEWVRTVGTPEESAPRDWPVPDGMTRVRYDPSSGEILGLECVGPVSGRAVDAWVPRASAGPGRCHGPVLRWLDGVWDLLRGRPKPIRDTIR